MGGAFLAPVGRWRLPSSVFSIAGDLPYSISMIDGNAVTRARRMVLAESVLTHRGTLSARRRHAFKEKASAPHCGDAFRSLLTGKPQHV
jgi:hypothetical protein